MISFIAKPNGSFKVKNMHKTGTICYFFKGMKMHPKKAKVVAENKSCLVVERADNGSKVNFYKKDNSWYLKNNNLLFGTNFIFDN